VLRGIAVGTGIALVLITFAAGWGCAHVRPADPRELLVYKPTAAEVRDLVRTLRELSWRETGLPTTLEFTYEAPPDSVLAWYLRDFVAARRVDDLGKVESWEQDMPVVTLSDVWPPSPPGGSDLVGQDFALSRSWSVSKISCALKWPPCRESVKWLVHRTFVGEQTNRPPALMAEAVEWAVVWVHAGADESVGASRSR
jgi:hypothetical protein